MNFSFFRSNLGVLATVALILAGAGGLRAQAPVGGAGRGGPAAGAGGGFVGGAGAGTVGANRQYQNTTLVGDATITSDVDTRRLIVVTDDATNENIRKIIADLDKPKPQVLINVVFLQVTHDNELDLGTEASYTSRVSVGANAVDGTGTATTKFGIGNALADPTASGYGFFYRLLGRDVNATIHALAAANKTEILSRPSILTRSNQQATILVGQSVPIITGSQVAQQTGAVTNTIQYQDVGIILRVTPFITTDGLVEMILSPEISSISATTVPLSNTVSSPVIDRRSADTVVVTRSDKTVVIGGLISNQNADRDSKIPVLGDIPILGYAFKRKNNNRAKTELLIFLTPHVINTPDELDRLTEGERQRLNLAPQAFDKVDMQKFLPPAAAAVR